jgi:ferredoxin-nitrate reductase
METQLDALGGGLLERAIQRAGIEVLTGRTTQQVIGNGRVEGVLLADGEELDADLVVVATGIAPDTELARAAGLAVARGILVDDELRTDRHGVWAVGECAEHRGVVYGLWAPLREQCRVAGTTLAGQLAAFHGAVPATTLKVADVPLFCAGATVAATDQDELIELDTSRGRYRKLVLDDGRLIGAILLGDLTEASQLHELIRSGEDVAPELLETGSAAADELICTCQTVSRTTIERAIQAGGLRTIEEVARATGASTGCGGCRPLVSDILATAERDAVTELRTLRAARSD